MEIKEVFEPIVSFMKSWQKKDKDISKQAAKDRLKLVLMQDRASVSPDFFEMMKKEIIDVIKKYIEIDEETLEVQLTRGHEDGLEGPALYANIPIKNIKPVGGGNETDGFSETEINEIVDNVADEILEEASKKVEDTVESIDETVNEAVEEKTEEIVLQENLEMQEEKPEELEKESETLEDETQTVDIIAENVAKEMKKSAAKVAANKINASKRTVKRGSGTKTAGKRSTKKKPNEE